MHDQTDSVQQAAYGKSFATSLGKPLDPRKMTHADCNSGRFIFPLLFLFISLSLINSFYADKHLSADGVHYFCSILDSKDFTYIAWSRQFANYLTEWPLVLAVRLGINDISILIRWFAFGIYLPYLISFLICIYALRDENKALLLYFLASLVAINLSVDYVLAGEHHVMVNISWPIIFILLRRNILTLMDGFLLWVLLIIFSRLYESALIPALIYSVICFVRLYYYKSKEQKVIIVSTLSLCFIVSAISLYSIINPRDAANREYFIYGLIAPFINPEAMAAACFIVVYTIGLILKSHRIIISAVSPLIIYALFKLFVDHGVSAVVSFASRTLSITLLPVLLIGAILVWYFKSELDRTGILTFVAFITVMVAGNLYNTNSWKDFRHEVKQLVKTHEGYIPIEETKLKDNPNRWSWNNTELGLVWSAPRVKAIILNQQNVRWEPFNPREKVILKNYLQYDDFFISNTLSEFHGQAP
jgi:hypothetical protein